MQLSGVSSTVDPGYIISLIRKLLPGNVESGISSRKDIAFGGESRISPHESSAEEMIFKIERLGRNGNNDGVSRHLEASVDEGAWEDCGCIIWDLSANRDHAEFMVV